MNELPLGEEVVAQDYVMLGDDKGTISCQHFGTYGLSSDGRQIAMTMLRSPAYTSYAINDKSLRKDRYSPRIDRGQRDFTFIVNASETAERTAELPWESAAAHQPPVAMNYFPGGEGRELLPLLVTDAPDVLISSFRRLSQEKYSVRLFHAGAGKVRAAVRTALTPGAFSLELGEYEFVTLLFDGRDWKKVSAEEEVL